MTHSGITGLALFLSFLVASAVFSAPAAAQNPADMDDLVATMNRLSLKVPMNVYARDPIRRHLGELARERCDQRAIADLGKALESAGYRREAVTALVSYSETCDGHVQSLRSAVTILLRLSDYQTAATGASKVIALEPFGGASYLQRALDHE